MKPIVFAVPPSIRGGEKEVAVVENSQAQLVCVAEGVPQPSLSWEKDGNPLSESTGEYTILPSGELVIDIAQVRETKKLSFCLLVSVDWWRVKSTSSKLSSDTIKEMLSKSFAQSLLISPFHQPDDAGSYTCIATNAVGQDSRAVTLSVHTHPVFTELLGDVALNKGERLLLACGASGIPPPRITWAFNNNIIPGECFLITET